MLHNYEKSESWLKNFGHTPRTLVNLENGGINSFLQAKDDPQEITKFQRVVQ